MKKLFMEPEMKVTKFEYEDIMQTSGVGNTGDAGFGNENEGSDEFE